MALTDGLVAAWKLDGNGNDSHGTYDLTASGTITYPTGKDNEGAQFAVTGNNYFRNASFPSPGTNFFSVSLWYKFVSTPSVRKDFFFWGAHSGYRRFLEIMWHPTVGVKAEFAWREDSSGAYINHQSLAVNQGSAATDASWHHCVFVVDLDGGKTRITLYIDGIQKATQTHATYDYSVPSTNFCGSFIGIGNNWTSSSCTGVLYNPANDVVVDEIYYWHRALTSAEVSDLYNSGAGKFYPFGNNYTQSLSESLSVSPTIILLPSKNIRNPIAISQNLSRTLSRTIPEGVSLSTVLTRFSSRTRRQSMTIAASSAISGRAKALLESISISATIGKTPFRTLSEVFSLTQSALQSFVSALTLTNAVTITQNAARHIGKAVSHNIALLASTATARTYFRTLTNALGIATSAVRTASRRVANAITLGQTLSFLRTYGRILTHAVSLRQTIGATLNGLNAFWRQKFADKVVNWTQKFQDKTANWTRKFLK